MTHNMLESNSCSNSAPKPKLSSLLQLVHSLFFPLDFSKDSFLFFFFFFLERVAQCLVHDWSSRNI